MRLFGHASLLGEATLDSGNNSCYWFGMFTRRIGPDPHANGAQTSSLNGCPDILEMEDGDFAVIGVDITAAASGKLAFGANCGVDERIVKIPRKTLVLAKAEIPNVL